VADDIGLHQGRDPGRINTSEDHDLRYWSKQLGVTEDKLMEAVRYVGNSVQKVREYLMTRSGLSNVMDEAPGSPDLGSADS
jgi:hypothetical protein